MQLKKAIDGAYQLFLAHDVPSPRLNAELLLMFVLGCERAYLFAHPDRELTEEEDFHYDRAIRERARGVPCWFRRQS
jgi:release factor glutamine methyltransferase